MRSCIILGTLKNTYSEQISARSRKMSSSATGQDPLLVRYHARLPDQDFKRSTKNNKVAYENLIVNVYLTKRITRNVSSLTPGCSLSHAIPHSRAAEGHYDYETRPTYRLTGGRIWLSPSPPVHSKCHNKRLLEPPLRKVEEAASYPLQRPVAQITNHYCGNRFVFLDP